jgi:hypothetical protein
MTWNLDRDRARSQLDEAKRFWDQARNGDPAGTHDLFGRPFRTPDGSEFRVEPHPDPYANYYLIHLAHLAEVGVISHSEFEMYQGRMEQK